MIWLIVRHVVLPHAENVFQPFSPQGSERLVVPMPTSSTLLIGTLSPLTLSQRLKGQLSNRLPEVLVARDTEPHDTTFPTLPRQRNSPSPGLQVAPGYSTTRGIAQFGPQAGNHRATAASRQRLHPLSRLEGPEKTFNLHLVVRHRAVSHQHLHNQHGHQTGLGPHDMLGHGHLRRFQVRPQFRRPCRAQPMLARKLLPLAQPQRGQPDRVG